MRVLFVSSGNSHYGIIPFIKGQGESLKKEGVHIDYFSIKGKGIFGYLSNIKPLFSYLKNNKFDLVHAHYGLIGLLCSLTFTRIPIVISVMGDDAYGDFNSRGKRLFSSYLGILLTNFGLFFAKKIIVKSQNILRAIPFKEKSIIIPNGVNFELFKPFNESLNRNVVLYLADKNIKRKNFKLLRDSLKLIDNDNIKLINPFPIEHKDFPNYLNSCSVFVLTSYNEGSPNVIKEAMACNIPIVSTNVGDVKDVFGNTKGCFIADFSPEDFSCKLRKALEYNKRTNGRESIEHLESSIIANKIIDVYKQVLNKIN